MFSLETIVQAHDMEPRLKRGVAFTGLAGMAAGLAGIVGNRALYHQPGHHRRDPGRQPVHGHGLRLHDGGPQFHGQGGSPAQRRARSGGRGPLCFPPWPPAWAWP